MDPDVRLFSSALHTWARDNVEGVNERAEIRADQCANLQQNNKLFLGPSLAPVIIFGNVVTEQYLPWRCQTMQVS